MPIIYVCLQKLKTLTFPSDIFSEFVIFISYQVNEIKGKLIRIIYRTI
jgi:hypothetical protein